MKAGRIRIIVVGAGYWGTKLVHEYLALSNLRDDLELYGVVDISPEKLQAIQGETTSYNLRFFKDFDKALQDDRIEAVHIATPNPTHYQLASKALEKGKHVLLEKPMTTTSREAFKLARVAEESGLVLQVGHIFRFNNALEKGRQIMREGILGRVFYANLTWASRLEPPADRDVIFDLAPHPLDVLNYLLNEWPSAVHAMGKSYLRNRDLREEVAFIHLDFPEDFLGNIYVSWLHRDIKERSVTVVGSSGTMHIDALNQRLTIAYDDGLQDIPIQPNNTMQDMQSHFVDQIKGKGPSYNSAIIGALVVQVLEAVHKSIRTGSRVEVISG